MKIAAAALLLATSLAGPATAQADCGDPGQDPCTGPVPTVDEVIADLAELTNPDIPATNKTNIVSPGFSPEEAGTIDDHLNRMKYLLPLPFVVTDIEPAPNNFAGATVETNGGLAKADAPDPSCWSIRGHWLITHDSATEETDGVWRVANRFIGGI